MHPRYPNVLERQKQWEGGGPSGNQAMKDFNGNNQHLELHPETNWQPMQWWHVVTMRSYCSSCCILKQLLLPNGLQGQPYRTHWSSPVCRGPWLKKAIYTIYLWKRPSWPKLPSALWAVAVNPGLPQVVHRSWWENQVPPKTKMWMIPTQEDSTATST